MAKTEITLPAMGESISEATITQILKKEGDTVVEDEAIFEIATDKVDSEISSTSSGTILKILHEEGDTVAIGEILAIIGDKTDKIETNTTASNKEINYTPIIKQDKSIFTKDTKVKEATQGIFLSPLVREIIKKEKISNSEVDKIKGTGDSNRITKKDILDFISKKNNNPIISKPAQQAQEKSYTGENVEIIEMDRMRKLIAGYMVESKKVSPHVTSFIDVDVTGLVNWRNKIKNKFLDREGVKISFTPIFIEAVSKALKDFPLINVSVDGDRIIRKKNINIGMATALPSGNLIVPVIKNADEKNLLGLAKAVNDLAIRGRENKLKPDEIQGGTFTITNLGNFGSITGTPIINQPEVAILAIGAIKKKPAVIETPLGDTIGIRHIMILSLAYDHRVVDGALGGMFLKRIAENLENINEEKEI